MTPAFARSAGSLLIEESGREVLDFRAATSGYPLGHAHPGELAAVTLAAQRLLGSGDLQTPTQAANRYAHALGFASARLYPTADLAAEALFQAAPGPRLDPLAANGLEGVVLDARRSGPGALLGPEIRQARGLVVALGVPGALEAGLALAAEGTTLPEGPTPNPLAVALTGPLGEFLASPGLRAGALALADKLREGLEALGLPLRARGLVVHVQGFGDSAERVAQHCFEGGLLVTAHEGGILIAPPLTVRPGEIEHAIAILRAALRGEAIPAQPVEALTPARDLLTVADLSAAQADDILSLAAALKWQRRNAPGAVLGLEGRTAALVFEKPSLRTRVSFEAAIRELGGHAVYLGKSEIGMGLRESIRDVTQNLATWCNVIIARLYWHKDIEAMAQESDVPVVNALTERHHPCQAFADLLTVREVFGDEKVPITYVGDGNNVARSLAELALTLGYPMTLCGPENFWLEPMPGLRQTSDIEQGLAEARVVYTDVWVSMGDEREQDQRLQAFRRFQVDQRMMALAAPEAIFLHCLPAQRGFEVTDEVIDSPQSRVYQQAENRLHVQKAILRRLLGL